MLTSTRRVPFLAQNSETGELYIRTQPYNGPIPTFVMQSMCKRIMSLDKTGSFRPLEALDFFTLLFRALEKVDWKLPEDPKKQRKYMSTCLHNEIYDVIKKHIKPLRKEYAQRENFLRIDRDTEEEVPVSIDEVIADEDSLYPDDSPEADGQYAREIFAAVFPLLKPTTQAALYAWIKADGNTREAAHIVRESHSTYHSRLKARFSEFRSAYFKLFSEPPYKKSKKVGQIASEKQSIYIGAPVVTAGQKPRDQIKGQLGSMSVTRGVS